MKRKPNPQDYQKSANWLSRRVGALPKTAVVLGSGLSDFVKTLSAAHCFPYERIPHFPHATVHRGELYYAIMDGEPIWVCSGRLHCYEGYQMWETAYPIGVLSLLGTQRFVLTNAAGALNAQLQVGDFVCITDHIKLTDHSPATGGEYGLFGKRFFSMETVYDPHLQEIAKQSAAVHGISLKEGVYAYMGGPQFETPAEIRMLQQLGADVVGMSTVAEVIFAAQCEKKVLCLSCVSNMAAGLQDKIVSHEEVLKTGAQRGESFGVLLAEILKRIIAEDKQK